MLVSIVVCKYIIVTA